MKIARINMIEFKSEEELLAQQDQWQKVVGDTFPEAILKWVFKLDQPQSCQSHCTPTRILQIMLWLNATLSLLPRQMLWMVGIWRVH